MPSNLFLRNGTYYARFFAGGQLQRISLRTGDPREAKRYLKALKQKATEQAFGIQSGATWEDAVVAYSQGVLDTGGVKESTAKRYRVSLRQIGPDLAGKQLATITVGTLAGLVAYRQSKGATNSTIRRDLTTISRVLSFARSQDMVDVNAVDAYDRSLIRERRAGISAPPDPVIEAAARAMEATYKPEMAPLIRFLRANGVRSAEALRATWAHVHGAELTIPETKNGRVRTIKVDLSALGTTMGRGRLFPTLPEDSGTLAGIWAHLRKPLPEGQRFRIHDLRHAYAIAQIRAGRDVYDLSHHLGHSSVKVTEIYLGYAAGRRASGR